MAAGRQLVLPLGSFALAYRQATTLRRVSLLARFARGLAKSEGTWHAADRIFILQIAVSPTRMRNSTLHDREDL